MISKYTIGDLFSYKSIVRDGSYDGVYEVVDIQIHTSSPSIFRYTLKRIPDIGQSDRTIARYEHSMIDEKGGFICINHNPRYSACHERRSSDPSMRGQHKVYDPRHPGSKLVSQKELIESGAIKIKEKSESVKRYLNSFYGLNAFKDQPIDYTVKPYEAAVNYAKHDIECMAKFYSSYKTRFRRIILNSEEKEMNKPVYKKDIDKQFKDTVKNVIFNGDATIVIWDDGSKTVVKRRKGERKDKEKAIMYCILEKQLGETFAKKMIDRFIEEGEKND